MVYHTDGQIIGLMIKNFHSLEMKLKGLLMKLKKLKNYKFLFVINFIIFVSLFTYYAKACSDKKFAKKDIFILSKINNQ